MVWPLCVFRQHGSDDGSHGDDDDDHLSRSANDELPQDSFKEKPHALRSGLTANGVLVRVDWLILDHLISSYSVDFELMLSRRRYADNTWDSEQGDDVPVSKRLCFEGDLQCEKDNKACDSVQVSPNSCAPTMDINSNEYSMDTKEKDHAVREEQKEVEHNSEGGSAVTCEEGNMVRQVPSSELKML
ncbi:unnamed protein product [Heligmosomoides polygyrus]|uniref:BRCT domain-containing protein n=1 Tax=Heligmosomoides polygyrus TaxID=6339 RepID=A0A3P8BHQ1_HELPZ|nr:unnamed protein product [Heligmosomoides polygyrus]